jgi:hypothetical protein
MIVVMTNSLFTIIGGFAIFFIVGNHIQTYSVGGLACEGAAQFHPHLTPQNCMKMTVIAGAIVKTKKYCYCCMLELSHHCTLSGSAVTI